ncbi:AraC family transcriptional regulator [Flavobacterium sp. ST-87]|uniref:AraC family transcriptional regulator n=1 Tax=Flavobacterium plantiphilum TaxID=3163297 RepID=A0ABW8XVW5_9FLAO
MRISTVCPLATSLGTGITLTSKGKSFCISSSSSLLQDTNVTEAVRIVRNLSDEILRTMAKEYHLSSVQSEVSLPMIAIEVNDVLQNYITSLKTILENPKLLTKNFIDLKIKELLFILIEAQPELKNIFFDFSEPFKIDLESFMIKNYMYNVNLERFAYLTGRSLTTFKRDFEKVFYISPHKWILQKRLDDAHYLIKEQKKSPSEIYVDLGFEDLSHFSYFF